MPVPRYRSKEVTALLSAGFRPFFLAAGVWAVVAVAAWVAMLRGAIALPIAVDPLVWHYHELLYGFVGAAIAGFLLTAIPNWTGRLPLQGAPLGFLVLLWLAGRAAMAGSAWIGPVAAAAIDLAFLVVFAAVVAREILAGRNWRNAPILGALAALIAANAMIHAGAFGHWGLEVSGKRLAIAVVLMLIALIGGRIVPSFTATWLRREGADAFPVPFGRFDRAVLILGILALGLWAATGLNAVSGAGLLALALAHAIRLARWRGSATGREPLLWVLHLGYAWLPAGLCLLGLAAWWPGLEPVAIHALTIGAMGTMILAVMTRASLGHTGRALTAGPGTVAVYALVFLASAARLLAPFTGGGYIVALEVAGGAWIAAFALFVALYLPLYLRR